MDLTKTSRIKPWIFDNETITKYDTLLDQILKSVSMEAKSIMGRDIESKERTQYYDLQKGQTEIRLNAFPVSDTADFKIYYDRDRNFNSDSLLSNNDYDIDHDEGLVLLKNIFYTGRKIIKIVYTGGLAVSVDNLIISYPDLVNAIDMQCVLVFKRKDDMPARRLRGDHGSIDLIPFNWNEYSYNIVKSYGRYV